MRAHETTTDGIASAPNAGALFDAYARETGVERIGGANPNLGMYRAMEKAGVSRLFSVDDDDGRLVGICVLIVAEHPHYSELVATIDTIYCLPEARSRGAGARLMIAAKRKAQELGARIVLISARDGSELHRQLEFSRSATPVQHIYEI